MFLERAWFAVSKGVIINHDFLIFYWTAVREEWICIFKRSRRKECGRKSEIQVTKWPCTAVPTLVNGGAYRCTLGNKIYVHIWILAAKIDILQTSNF